MRAEKIRQTFTWRQALPGKPLKSVELFAGAGGLALGVSRAGFRHLAVVERDRDACETVRANQGRRVPHLVDWPLREGDVAQFDYSEFGEDIDLLSGGPPCQPFSLGGKHRGKEDARNMFPEVVRAVQHLKPKAILVENVRGLVRQSFMAYFEYIILQLSHPTVTRLQDEDWLDHLSRLEQHHTSGKSTDLSYNVVFRVVNAANYGVPQRRERVLIVGFRSDLGMDWSFPNPTHSRDALLHDQYVTGEYWERHEVPLKQRQQAPERFKERIREISPANRKFLPAAWRTVRDAIGDLPSPSTFDGDQSKSISNHLFQPGARPYPGHTGSPLDEPAKTLKAGDHGVPGGENMLTLPDGNVRYFSVRESARLQTFPDEIIFPGSWTESMRQLGNAVPVSLGEKMAMEIHYNLARSAG